MLFLRGANLFARPFDPARLTFTGSERLLTAGVSSFSVSDDGTVVYQPERIAVSRLTWFNRRGRPMSTLGEPGLYLTSGAFAPRATSHPSPGQTLRACRGTRTCGMST